MILISSRYIFVTYDDGPELFAFVALDEQSQRRIHPRQGKLQLMFSYSLQQYNINNSSARIGKVKGKALLTNV